MALSVNNNTYVITVPKADLTLIQATPTEIRELNINAFHLELRAWEASDDGIAEPSTHNHNTEVTLGGLTFARVVDILDPYTITFEDGQYAVNLVGANSNIGDRVNVNQVSVRSQNSAGLISSPDIEYASFNGGIIIDVNSGNSGTVYPTGTERRKVNNITDALLIASYRGFAKIFLHSDIILDTGANLNNFLIEGQSHVETDVLINPGAAVEGTTIRNVAINGTLDGGNVLEYCVIEDLTYVYGHIHNCSLYGKIELGGNDDAYIVNCSQLDMNVNPEIDMGGSGQDLVMPDYTGMLIISNLIGANKIGIGLDGGRVVLTNTVISGFIHLSGVGLLVDESENRIPSGTWNGGVTIVNELIEATVVQDTQKKAKLAAFKL